jgi:predicted amidohydrolase
MSRRLKVGAVQYALKPLRSAEDFFIQCRQILKVAGEYRCDLLVFPEYFSIQLLSTYGPDTPLLQGLQKIADLEKLFVEFFSREARENSVNIVAGTLPVRRNTEIRNAAYVFTRAGVFDFQEKIYMTRFEKEEWFVKPGTELKIFEMDFGKLAVNTCYDIEFPELAREASLRGVEIIACPSCTDDRRGWYRVRACAAARAIENQIYVVHSSTVGGLPGVPAVFLNYGEAAVLGPSDYVFPRDGLIAQGVPNDETIVFADLDLDLLDLVRKAGSVLNYQDTRTPARVQTVPAHFENKD